MAYRDDLQAAHERIAVLERENRALRSKEPTPDTKEKDIFGDIKRPVTTFFFVRRAPVLYCFETRGKVGAEIQAQEWPQEIFRPDRLIIEDSSSWANHGTSFRLSLGVLPVYAGLSSAFQRETAFEVFEAVKKARESGNDALAEKIIAAYPNIGKVEMPVTEPKIAWRTIQPGLPITFLVKFTEACEWRAYLHGWSLT
jgi:hypothetical protein